MVVDSTGVGPDRESRVKIWSPSVRILHWLLTFGLMVSFLTADHGMRVHFRVGLGILSIVLLRALMGLYGSHHVRFENFVPTPGALRKYLSDLMKGEAAKYQGHDPAGGAMVATLLTGVSASSYLQGENLIGGMITGWKRKSDEVPPSSP